MEVPGLVCNLHPVRGVGIAAKDNEGVRLARCDFGEARTPALLTVVCRGNDGEHIERCIRAKAQGDNLKAVEVWLEIDPRLQPIGLGRQFRH